MASFVASKLLLLTVSLIYFCIASPVPEGTARLVQDDDDANASAPSNFLNCANGVGQGNAFNNCTMPSAPSGFPSPSIPGQGQGGLPSIPGAGSMPGNLPSAPGSPPNINQGIDCATAVGQGNGFNNCSNIFNPASRQGDDIQS